MDKMTKKIIGAFIAIIVVAAAILGVYSVMNRQAEKEAKEDVLPTTEVGKILAKDLELSYPETPTEVIKLYWRINCCMYNEKKLSDENIEALLKQLRLLYDEELLATESNSYEAMLENFKTDRKKYKDSQQTISSAYIVQKNDTIVVKKVDNRDCTSIISSIMLTAKGDTTKTFEEFFCRKDSNGKWKILGWQQTTAGAAAEVGVQ